MAISTFGIHEGDRMYLQKIKINLFIYKINKTGGLRAGAGGSPWGEHQPGQPLRGHCPCGLQLPLQQGGIVRLSICMDIVE